MTMKNISTRLCFIIGALLSVLLSSGNVLSADCIEIASPQNGSTVKDTVLVEGKAELPPGHHLWVLAGIVGTRDWWPQGGGEAEIIADTWEVLARIGKEGGDWNMRFRVAAIAAPESVHDDLQRWVTHSANIGRWDPITMPNTSEECEVEIIKLTKSR
jgi:hypothetical protein